jgi:hypothetical protein
VKKPLTPAQVQARVRADRKARKYSKRKLLAFSLVGVTANEWSEAQVNVWWRSLPRDVREYGMRSFRRR